MRETYSVHRWADAIVRMDGKSQAFATLREAEARCEGLRAIGLNPTIEDISTLPTDEVRTVEYGPIA